MKWFLNASKRDKSCPINLLGYRNNYIRILNKVIRLAKKMSTQDNIETAKTRRGDMECN